LFEPEYSTQTKHVIINILAASLTLRQ